VLELLSQAASEASERSAHEATTIVHHAATNLWTPKNGKGVIENLIDIPG
jgi:hypothetical protein